MFVRVGVVVMLAAAAALTVVGCGVGGSLETPGAVTAIIGPDGGLLESGGLTLVVPAGAVPAPTEFVMALVTAAPRAAPPNGLALLSGGQFDVNGVNTFATPVSITFPLSRRLRGDSRVPLWQLYNGVTWRITDADVSSPVSALVSADGRFASAAVRHFTVYAILADYAPFEVGRSWTYRRTIQTTGGPPGPPEPDISTVVATITSTTGTVGELTTYVWSEKDKFDNPVQTLYYHRSDAELLLVAIEEEGQPIKVLTPPAKVLMLPPAPGQTWEVTTGLFDTTAQASVTAETITVGVKEYDTMKVHIAPPSAGEYLDMWFAPNVGPVKREQSFVGPDVGTVVIEMDLQSYSLP